MSSRRQTRSRTASGSNKHLKNSNIQLFKLIDPIVQSVLFVLFFVCLDVEKKFSYRTLMLLIFYWQGMSCIINFFFVGVKLRRVERVSFFIAAIIYLALFFYFERHGQETFVAINEVERPTIPLYRGLLMSAGMIIAFWYNFICFREFKSLHMSINRGDGR